MGGVEATWEPEPRIFTLRIALDARASGEDAQALARVLEAWVGDTLPFRTLVDSVGADRVTLAWRLDWAAWCKKQRGRVAVGFYNVPDDAVERILLFERLAQVETRVFRGEPAARKWAASPREAQTPGA